MSDLLRAPEEFYGSYDTSRNCLDFSRGKENYLLPHRLIFGLGFALKPAECRFCRVCHGLKKYKRINYFLN